MMNLPYLLYSYEELSNISLYDFVNIINDLVSAFQEVFKLGQLILTIYSRYNCFCWKVIFSNETIQILSKIDKKIKTD